MKPSPTNSETPTGKGQKRKGSTLPVPDLLNVLQGTMGDLQAASLPVSAVQLPVPDGRPPRVALILEGVIFDGGRLLLAPNELAPQGIEGDPNGSTDTAIVPGEDA